LYGPRFFFRPEPDALATPPAEEWTKSDCDQFLSMASMCEVSVICIGLMFMGTASCCKALKLINGKACGGRFAADADTSKFTARERRWPGALGICIPGAINDRGAAAVCCSNGAKELLGGGLDSDCAGFSMIGILASLHCGHLSRRRLCSQMPPPPHGTQ
jgi:hypothetical protein